MLDATSNLPAVKLVQACALYPGRGGAGRLALQDVSLSARAGDILALLGPNGAGKSTVLRVVAGLLATSAGEVRVEGVPAAERDRRDMAQVVAFVPQTEGLAYGFRVREVVSMGRAPHQDAWMRERAEDAAAVDDALRRCDLVSLADRRVETLSGGEGRRVAVARALAQRPRVLLLDEPGAFLDVRHRLELYDLLADVAPSAPLACLLAMHELGAAARIASSVVLLKGGKVVASGATEETLTPEHLRATFDADVHTGRDIATGERYFVATRSG